MYLQLISEIGGQHFLLNVVGEDVLIKHTLKILLNPKEDVRNREENNK